MNTEDIVAKVFAAALGAYDLWAIYVGDKLGLYRALKQRGHPMTAVELAEATGVHVRYVTEWLEQQTVGGFLEWEAGVEPRFRLQPGAEEVFCDEDSLNFLAPFARLVTAAGLQLPALLEAYRRGGGAGWSQFGEDMRTGQAEMNRPWFLKLLGTTWLPTLPSLHQRLLEGGRVADVGCGEGWSSIAIALSYPHVRVDGFDLDQPSIEAARVHAVGAGVSDRVTFQAVDAGTVGGEGTYDLVTAFECIHDLAQPVAVLEAMRRLAKPDAEVIVMDERVAESFPGGDDVERLMYGFSLFTCLPDGMSHHPSEATGTVMRPATFERYARQAGFVGVEILPIENDLWRFYRLMLG